MVGAEALLGLRLVVPVEVHAGVEGADLVGVAVEHEGGALLGVEGLTDAALVFLAPSGVVVVGVDVGVEAVFVGGLVVPTGGGLRGEEFDGDDGFGGFVAVFPGNGEADGGAVLVGEDVSIEAEGEQGERVHGLVHAETFRVRPADAALRPPFLDLGVEVAEELDIFGGGEGLALLDELRE